jgi:Fic family protein
MTSIINSDWPEFRVDLPRLMTPLAEARFEQGRLFGRFQGVGWKLRQDATLSTLTGEVVNTSAIEGERLPTAQVRSSVARPLGIDISG